MKVHYADVSGDESVCRMSTSNTKDSPIDFTSNTKDCPVDYISIGKKRIPKLNWIRLNYKGEDHDNRRLVDHRDNDCTCDVCYRELNKLPPDSPVREKITKRKLKLEEQAIKRIKRMAKKEVKDGKQCSIRNFFRY